MNPETLVLEVSPENMPCLKMQELFGYWENLSGADALPEWTAFDPTQVMQVLPDILLYEAQTDGGYFVRVIGENCQIELEISAERRPLEDFMPPENYQDVKQRLDLVRDQEVPHLVRKTLGWRNDANRHDRATEYTVLFLPFRYGGEQISHKIINALYFRHLDQEELEIADLDP